MSWAHIPQPWIPRPSQSPAKWSSIRRGHPALRGQDLTDIFEHLPGIRAEMGGQSPPPTQDTASKRSSLHRQLCAYPGTRCRRGATHAQRGRGTALRRIPGTAEPHAGTPWRSHARLPGRRGSAARCVQATTTSRCSLSAPFRAPCSWSRGWTHRQADRPAPPDRGRCTCQSPCVGHRAQRHLHRTRRRVHRDLRGEGRDRERRCGWALAATRRGTNSGSRMPAC